MNNKAGIFFCLITLQTKEGHGYWNEYNGYIDTIRTGNDSNGGDIYLNAFIFFAAWTYYFVRTYVEKSGYQFVV